MGFFDEVKSALGEIFSEFAQPVIWRGRTFKCTMTQGQSGVNLETGGFVPECNFNIKFLESELDGERPKVGDVVEIGKSQYRIEWVFSHSGRGQVEVVLKPYER